MIKYEVISSGSKDSLQDFVDFVNRAIENGWTPVGGIATSNNGIFIRYMQAMTKEES